MIKAIIFDVDGVLVDSQNSNVAFFQKLLSKFGYTDVTREHVLECFHLPMLQTIEKLTGLKDPSEIQRIFDLGSSDMSLRDSSLLDFPEKLEESLEHLHKKYKLAIVTGRIRNGVDSIFSERAIGHLFSEVVAYEDYSNPKPHPEPLLVAAQKLGIKPREAVYVGDSPSDIASAKAANMKSIYLSPEAHIDATGNVVEFKNLLEAIEQL
ncbi:MAG TPA: HAD family hydrolase [Candidatus Saccharimonadales bacterium]|nr:HAD family hydrolase [Candidatus Saccharimonadales bacterium]